VFFHALANLPLYGRPDHLEIIKRFWMQSACIEVLIIAAGTSPVLGAVAPFLWEIVAKVENPDI